MHKLLIVLVLLFSWAAPAELGAQLIQNRILPAQGERGRLGDAQVLPMVKISGRVMRLAPGGVIFDQHNRTIIHAHLPVGAEILYTRDQTGNVQRIYILTDQERERLARAGKR